MSTNITKEQQIAGSYALILSVLRFVSMVLALIMALLPIVKINLGFFYEGFGGFDLAKNILTSVAKTDENGILQWETSFFDYVMLWFFAIMLIVGITGTVTALCSFFKRNKIVSVKSAKSEIKASLVMSAVYFAVCFLYVLAEAGWEISLILEERVLSTPTYIPVIGQILLYISTLIIYKHYTKAIKGEVKPLRLNGIQDFAVSSRETPMGSTSAYKEAATARSSAEQLENLELLQQYKDLLDCQIITQEEFNAKKKELLEERHTVSIESKPVPKEKAGTYQIQLLAMDSKNATYFIKIYEKFFDFDKYKLLAILTAIEKQQFPITIIKEEFSYEDAKNIEVELEAIGAEVELIKVESKK